MQAALLQRRSSPYKWVTTWIHAVKLLTAGIILACLLAVYIFQMDNPSCRIPLIKDHLHHYRSRISIAFVNRSRMEFVELNRMLHELVDKQQNFLINLTTVFKQNFRESKSETIKPYYSFLRRPETAHVDCGRILRGDLDYLTFVRNSRPVLISKANLYNGANECKEIRERVLPPLPMKKMVFGVAQARIVYRDYELIEDELRSTYHPQNYFCYSIDQKANRKFRLSIMKLAECFPNVFITQEEFNVDEYGHNMNNAHYACMQLLSQKQGWEYILLLQNHDVIIKSPYEMVEIYKLLDGANDVEIGYCPEDRWDHSKKWDARSLNFFRNESSVLPKQLDASIVIAKGAVQASLSRAAVEWLVDIANLTTLIDRLNEKPFGIDEILIQSLQVSDDLDMPGRFTSECLMRGKKTTFITRMSQWTYNAGDLCRSEFVRKAICIDRKSTRLQSLAQYPHIMANKMLPKFDYAIVECVHEMIFNRTFLEQVDHPLNRSYYSNMINVKFNRNRKWPDSNYKLECS